MSRVAKRHKTIMNLPNERITWVCYNEEMIPYYETLIKELRGEEFFNKYVTVVADGQPELGSNTYFDRSLYELRGNGYD